MTTVVSGSRPGLLRNALRTCPSSFHMRARKPENDLNLSAGNTTYFAVFPGMRTVDIDTWEPRTPTVQENHDAVKVLDSLENVHVCVSYVPYCELEGVPPAMLLPTSCWSRMKYFTRPFRVGQAEESWIWGIQMAQTIDIDVFAAFESAPPLTYYEDAIECAWAHCEAGFPVEVGCGAVLGGTGPATHRRWLGGQQRRDDGRYRDGPAPEAGPGHHRQLLRFSAEHAQRRTRLWPDRDLLVPGRLCADVALQVQASHIAGCLWTHGGQGP